MAHRRSRGNLVDYLVSAIEPALIILMVGSMMFFLLDLWYEGPFIERMRWVLFWFVLGIVLITRVSMQIGSSLAMGYGVALGGAVALVASTFAGFDPFLLLILGIVWWATHKLTFDSTLLDEDQDAGVGLLQESGVDALSDARPPSASNDDGTPAMDASLLGEHAWWKIWRRDAHEARRPNAPGVWLVYFTIASLPIFGVAQWFVPAIEEERRDRVFLYFLVYIASAMGLLLATSFLNLRRYLRQRRLKMPGAMTAAWLSTGTILIVGLTALAAALPFSGAGLQVLRGATSPKSDLRASRLAVLKDSAVQGRGATSEGPAASKSEAGSTSPEKAEGSGNTNDPNAAQQTSGKGQPGGDSGPGRAKSGAPTGERSPSGASSSGQQQSEQQASGEQGKSANGRTENASDRGKDAGQGGNQGDRNESNQNGKSSSDQNRATRDGAQQSPRLPSLRLQAPSWLMRLFKVVGMVGLVYGVLRYGMTILQALRDLLASLFGGLWGARPKRSEKDRDKEPGEPRVPLRPFAAYANPFNSGRAGKLSPDELVLYSFEALEAWATEHDLGRSAHETPTEFLGRLRAASTELGHDATPLVGHFVTIIYGQRSLKPEILPALREFWQTIERPLALRGDHAGQAAIGAAP
jgi:hypothetical protein